MASWGLIWLDSRYMRLWDTFSWLAPASWPSTRPQKPSCSTIPLSLSDHTRLALIWWHWIGSGIVPLSPPAFSKHYLFLSPRIQCRKDPEVLKLVAVLKEKYAGKYVVIGRDKNDYVKGVRHKLLAFERFLQDHPEMQGKVVLIQVSLSTSEVNESQSNVSNVAARINSNFGTIEYVPVVYLHQDISFNYYLALLIIADASLITSLRDGMNLTSHEYVVCQEEKRSPLIISEVSCFSFLH